jgi:hypothetical protein
MGAHAGPCALQGAVDGRDGRLEQFRGLLGRAAEDVTQDQHGAWRRREVLDRHEERELDRLFLDDRGMLVVLGGRQLAQQLVGIGLQPQDLARHRRPRPPVEGVQAGVGRDLVQPGPERGPAGERRPPPPRAQEGLLDEVLAVVEGAEHPVAVHVELPAMALKQFGERSVIGGDGHVGVTAIAAKLISRFDEAATARGRG